MEPLTNSWVALLRGINVGGKHILPMKLLVEMFTEAKCVNVRSYIQSGNVVFTAPPKVAKALPDGPDSDWLWRCVRLRTTFRGSGQQLTPEL